MSPEISVSEHAGPLAGERLCRTTLSQLKNLAKLTGIPTKTLTSHNFRRYFVSQCADCGIDIGHAMEWLEHSDWKMVRRYYRLRDEHAQASARNFWTGTPAAAERQRDRPHPRVRKKVANGAAKRVVD